MLKIKKIICNGLAMTLMCSFCACNGIKSETTDPEVAYLNDLVDGTYYVRHLDNYCEEVYLGDASFDEEKMADHVTASRLCWFKEDWSSIPTLYTGDSLILYSESILDEVFVFERYYDIGCTIGLRIPAITKTGRLQLSTDVQELLTYPNGDTDAINDLHNETVILESLGGRPMRAMSVTENTSNSNDFRFYYTDGEFDASNILSDYGTVLTLVENESYEAEVYNGTVRSKYIFKADVHALGCMEIIRRNDYHYELGKIIVIEIPDWFESGYYMINGQGFFRYVRGSSFDDTTNFNIPNKLPESVDYSDRQAFVSGERETDGENDNQPPSIRDEVTFDYISYLFDESKNEYITSVVQRNSDGNKFIIDIPITGKIKVSVGFVGYEEGEELSVSAGITTPDEKYYQMFNTGSKLEAGLTIQTPGNYQIIFYNLSNDYIPEILVEEVASLESE